jgi:Uma2 family endonuclease
MANSWPPLAKPEQHGARRTLTIEEWVDLPEDEEGELVDGELVEEEVPDAVHELAVSWFIHVIRVWLGGQGFVFGSELKIRTRARSGRKPDLSVYLPERKAPRKHGVIAEPPDILVEIVTPTPRDERRDRVEKMAEYAAFGVRYYWLVDPALGTMEIFERDASGNYTKVVGTSAGLIDPVPGCSGLAIDLDALWRELERLADD